MAAARGSPAKAGRGSVEHSDSGGGQRPRQLMAASGDRQQGGAEEQRQRCVCGGAGTDAALDSGRGSFGQRPLKPGYTRARGNRESRPRQPVRARHAAASRPTRGPQAADFLDSKINLKTVFCVIK
jgi:hypothetical protein